MAVHQVLVHNAEGSLSFDPTLTPLAQGDWVWWSFLDVPAGFIPFIQFQAPAPLFGPFHSARSRGNDSVIGKGNTGVPGMYTYRAVLLDPETEQMITSAWLGGIYNEVTSDNADTSPEAFATYHPGAPAGQQITVTPDSLCLNNGDTALWVVSGLQEGMFVTMHFDAPEGGRSANRSGPFAALCAVAGGAAGEMRLHGTGFMTEAGSDTPIPARFSYTIKVWDADGTLLGSHDPAIDNLGPPIPG